MISKKTTLFILCSFMIINIYTDELRILTAEEAPMNYYLDNGTFSGTSTDIVKEIVRYLKLDTEIEVLPWARAYMYSKRSPDIAIYTAGRTQERIDLGFYFIGPIITRNHGLWSLKNNHISINNLQDIKDMNLTIAGMRGSWRSKYFIDMGINVEEVTSHELGLRKLFAGRIDLWISSYIEAPEIAEIENVDIEQIEMLYIFKEAPSFIMISKDSSEENINKWENAYSEIQKTDFFENATEKWSNILGIDLNYSIDKGFFVE